MCPIWLRCFFCHCSGLPVAGSVQMKKVEYLSIKHALDLYSAWAKRREPQKCSGNKTTWLGKSREQSGRLVEEVKKGWKDIAGCVGGIEPKWMTPVFDNTFTRIVLYAEIITRDNVHLYYESSASTWALVVLNANVFEGNSMVLGL